MKTTDYLNLRKPEADDFYDVYDFNYNADKLDEVLNTIPLRSELKDIKIVSLSASKWSSTYPYTQTVDVSDITEDSKPILEETLTGTEIESTVKAYRKAASCLVGLETMAGQIKAIAYKKPSIDFTIGLRGWK